MKTRFYPVYFAFFVILCLPMSLHAQLQEIGLKVNPTLSQPKDHKRADQVPVLKYYLPIGDSITFCPDGDLANPNTDSIIFNTCHGPYQGVFEIGNFCITYQHTGSRSSDIVCLEVCDSNGACKQYEIAFITGPVLTLPFVDDFSTHFPYPDSMRWLDRDVFVNTTLAERPLTVGVATFDGLDPAGSPYGEKAGFSDNLTSAFIDLSGQTEVYFSFFAQPKGVGIKPRTRDSLVVDFRNEQGEWVRVWQMEGLSNDFSISDPAPDFAFNRWIIADSFMHKSFQFRFRNKSKNEGLQELWHVDYIRIGEDDLTRETFRDIAFRYLPTTILDPYSSMPANQFEIKEVRRNIISRLNNLDQVDLTMNDPTLTIKSGNQTLLRRTFIEPVQAWLLPRGASSFDFDMNDQGSTNYEELQSGLFGVIKPGEKHSILSTLNFTRADEILGATSNNLVQQTTRFDNYYSYDDGTAESAIIDRGAPGVRPTVLAMEFHNNAPDQLQGVQIQIPHIEGNSSSQFFNLFVWIDSLDDSPEYVQTGVKVYYPDTYFDTLQGFTTYALVDSNDQKIDLDLPEGQFYIGWEQVDISGQKIPIGYDLNSPAGINFMHFNVGQGWQSGLSSGLRHGSLMIRPVLGAEEVIPTKTNNFTEWKELWLFPNPSEGVVYLDGVAGSAGKIEIFNLLGQLLFETTIQRSIDLSALEPGTYAIKITNLKQQKTTSRLLQIIK